jgi:hypothetical protein
MEAGFERYPEGDLTITLRGSQEKKQAKTYRRVNPEFFLNSPKPNLLNLSLRQVRTRIILGFRYDAEKDDSHHRKGKALLDDFSRLKFIDPESDVPSDHHNLFIRDHILTEEYIGPIEVEPSTEMSPSPDVLTLLMKARTVTCPLTEKNLKQLLSPEWGELKNRFYLEFLTRENYFYHCYSAKKLNQTNLCVVSGGILLSHRSRNSQENRTSIKLSWKGAQQSYKNMVSNERESESEDSPPESESEDSPPDPFQTPQRRRRSGKQSYCFLCDEFL